MGGVVFGGFLAADLGVFGVFRYVDGCLVFGLTPSSVPWRCVSLFSCDFVVGDGKLVLVGGGVNVGISDLVWHGRYFLWGGEERLYFVGEGKFSESVFVSLWCCFVWMCVG